MFFDLAGAQDASTSSHKDGPQATRKSVDAESERTYLDVTSRYVLFQGRNRLVTHVFMSGRVQDKGWTVQVRCWYIATGSVWTSKRVGECMREQAWNAANPVWWMSRFTRTSSAFATHLQ